jgi:hypothetical protein
VGIAAGSEGIAADSEGIAAGSGALVGSGALIGSADWLEESEPPPSRRFSQFIMSAMLQGLVAPRQ